ncbi:MAG: hypothetical protein J6T10_15065 [Methanobrevibacter sp.]|nr:hypothetical protein [Methanobrevibacter sp.]
MKAEKFNELNQNMSKFFDACEFNVTIEDGDEKTVLKVIDKDHHDRVVVEMYFINFLNTNCSNKGYDLVEWELQYDFARYDKDSLTPAELSAVKNLIQMYK